MKTKIKNLIKDFVYYRVVDFLISPSKMCSDCWKDLKSLMGKYKYNNHIILVVGLPKSGTTWIENFLYNVPGYVARRLNGSSKRISRHELDYNAFKNCSLNTFSYIKTHINPSKRNLEVLTKTKIKKTIILIRDPRDVAVSRYYHLLNFPKNNEEIYAVDYNKLTKEEGLSHSMDIVLKVFIPWIEGWLAEASQNESYLIIKYEDILDDSLFEFQKINKFCEFNLSNKNIVHILQEIDENMRKGFKLNTSTGNKSTFRKGIHGDWKSHFSESDKEKFKIKAGKLLIELKYENNMNW